VPSSAAVSDRCSRVVESDGLRLAQCLIWGAGVLAFLPVRGLEASSTAQLRMSDETLYSVQTISSFQTVSWETSIASVHR